LDFERIICQARQIFAGILAVFQGNLTKHGEKFAKRQALGTFGTGSKRQENRRGIRRQSMMKAANQHGSLLFENHSVRSNSCVFLEKAIDSVLRKVYNSVMASGKYIKYKSNHAGETQYE